MGRTVVGDENQLDSQVDSIFQSGCSVQVGLLVGKSGKGGSRDMVFSLIPTPMKDGDVAASLGAGDVMGVSRGNSRKGGKGKQVPDSAPIVVNTDWVGEHARQVSRMLFGGMQVMGVFVFSSEGSFKSSLATLWQTVMAVAESVSWSLDKGLAFEYLLLHVSSSPRKLSCRSCSTGSNFSSTVFHPCEWKVGKLLNNLQEFSCTYTVDIKHPVHYDPDSDEAAQGLIGYLTSGIDSEAERLHAAIAVVDGSLLEPDRLLGSGNRVHQVELLVPLHAVSHLRPQSGENVLGYVVCKGEIHARAYAVVRDSVSHAVDDLKADILGSLRARIGLLVDEAEQAADDASLHSDDENSVHGLSSDRLLIGCLSPGVPEQSFIMPRRVIVPWLQEAMICDYMLPHESFEDVEERAMELFGTQPMDSVSAIIEPETFGTVPAKHITTPKRSTEDVDHIIQSPTLVEPKTVKLSFRGSLFFLIPALVLVIALLLSIRLTFGLPPDFPFKS